MGKCNEDLCELLKSKIKVFKGTLDETSISFHCGARIKAALIESDDEGNVTLTGKLLIAASIFVPTSKRKSVTDMEQCEWGHEIDKDKKTSIVL